MSSDSSSSGLPDLCTPGSAFILLKVSTVISGRRRYRLYSQDVLVRFTIRPSYQTGKLSPSLAPGRSGEGD